MIKTFEELSDMVQDYEYNCPHDIDANLVIYEKMSEILNECMGKLKEISKHMEFYEEEDVYEELERLFWRSGDGVKRRILRKNPEMLCGAASLDFFYFKFLFLDLMRKMKWVL